MDSFEKKCLDGTTFDQELLEFYGLDEIPPTDAQVEADLLSMSSLQKELRSRPDRLDETIDLSFVDGL